MLHLCKKTNDMSVNKNAVIRYMYLDQMLADRHHYYTRAELTEKCNEKMRSDGYSEVNKRTIEMDLVALQDAPFSMEIVEDSEVFSGKRVIRYADQAQSLFAKPMTEDEKHLLSEVLNTLGQFSGLDNFSWLEDLQSKLNDPKSFGRGTYNLDRANNEKIISFSSNEYLRNKESLGWFFSAIANKKVVSVVYRKFNTSEPVTHIVYPYHLKQYNERWYLICNHYGSDEYPYNPNFLMNLPLDRIEDYKEIPEIEYIDCTIDIAERYEDVVGITYHPERGLQKILICVAPETCPYIDTKPLHSSQIKLPNDEQELLRNQYRKFGTWTFYSIECIPDDYELPRLLMSFGSNMMVIKPKQLVTQIKEHLRKQVQNYTLLCE